MTAFAAPSAADDSSSIIAKGIRSIAITATDHVRHEAEVAKIKIGYELYAQDHQSAYAAATRASNAIIGALQSGGMSADTIESEHQSISRTDSLQLNRLPDPDRASHAFVARQSWNARTTADSAARILDIAIKAGANCSGNIEWSLKDPNAASTEAAAKAVQRARAQAEAMAIGLNVRLGQLLYASNQVQARPTFGLLHSASAEPVAAAPPLSITPRQIETTATVYAVFAIE